VSLLMSQLPPILITYYCSVILTYLPATNYTMQEISCCRDISLFWAVELVQPPIEMSYNVNILTFNSDDTFVNQRTLCVLLLYLSFSQHSSFHISANNGEQFHIQSQQNEKGPFSPKCRCVDIQKHKDKNE